jgi:YggT family protein
MFVFRNVLLGTATVLDYVLWLYMWIIIARALISWVNPDPWNPIVQFLDRATEPVLASPFAAGWGGAWALISRQLLPFLF